MSTQQYLNHIITTITIILDKHAPLRTIAIRTTNKPKHPLSEVAVKAKRWRRKTEKRYFQTFSVEDKLVYDKAKIAAKNAIINSRIEFLQAEVNSSNNPRVKWRNLNKLLHRNSNNNHNMSDNDNKALAHTFNYFIEKITTIHKCITNRLQTNSFPDINLSHLRHNTQNILHTFDEVTPSEINKLIQTSCKKSSPVDPFPNHVLINSSDQLSVVLTKLINLSFRDGFFHPHLK